MFLFQLDDLFEAIAEYGFRNVDWYDWLFIIGALLVGCIPVIMILYVIIDMFSDKEAKLVKKLRSCNDPSKLTRKQRLLHDVLSKKDQYKLTLHEQFLCLKRLEQLRQLTRNDRLALAKLYVDWFEDTDKDVDAAIRITKAISDDGSTWGTLKNAILLYDNGRIKEAFAQFRKLVNLDDDKQFPLLLNEDEGPAAAWYVAQIMLSTGNDSDTLLHAYNFILRAAMGGYSAAVAFYEDPTPEIKKQQEFRYFDAIYTAAFENPKDELAAHIRSLRYGDKRSCYAVGMHYYRSATESAHDAKRAFLLLNLAYTLGHAEASFPLGVLYGNGTGTERNNIRAKRCYMDCIQHNTDNAVTAMYNLGLIAKNQRNHSEAIEWYRACMQTMADKMNWELDALKDEDPSWDSDRWQEEALAVLNTYQDIRARK